MALPPPAWPRRDGGSCASALPKNTSKPSWWTVIWWMRTALSMALRPLKPTLAAQQL